MAKGIRGITSGHYQFEYDDDVWAIARKAVRAACGDGADLERYIKTAVGASHWVAKKKSAQDVCFFSKNFGVAVAVLGMEASRLHEAWPCDRHRLVAYWAMVADVRDDCVQIMEAFGITPEA